MEDKKQTNKEVFGPVMAFYVKTSVWVAGPAILAFIVKSYVDISQTAFFILIAVAFLVTIYGIYKEIKDYKKTLEK